MRLILVKLALIQFFVASTSLAQTPIPRPFPSEDTNPSYIHISNGKSIVGILSSRDIDRYKTIFSLQRDGRWSEAKQIINRLRDERLMGYVLSQKYLHPNKYRSNYSELKIWMNNYADLPQASRIYKLAIRRRPKNSTYPKKPIKKFLSSLSASTYSNRNIREKSASARQLQSTIQARIRKGWPTGALKLLDKPSTKKIMSKEKVAILLRDIAASYYRAGKDHEAVTAAGRSIKNVPHNMPLAHWWGGLAAWRSNKIDTAHMHFTALAETKETSDWLKSAGAFWSARTLLVNRRPEEYTKMLELGAQHHLTFYGLISKRALGEKLEVNWEQPPLSEFVFHRILKTLYGVRAVALLQIGFKQESQKELLTLAAAEPTLQSDIINLAINMNLPSLSLKMAHIADVSLKNTALYPIPDWNLKNNLTLDRALIYAFVRQESAFNERAKSRAGARGLMQLMPSTASFISRKRSLRGRKKHELYNPELNILLGQKYIRHLLSDKYVPNNLFHITTAYNAGPGNMRNWEAKMNYNSDPLLFIESLPSKETRLFIERILTNLWLYRSRLNQEAHSLSDVAAGLWPNYYQLDPIAGKIKKNEY